MSHVVDIAKLLKYHREGNISTFTLCTEIEEDLSSHLDIRVELTNDTVSSTTETFIATLLPIKTENGYRLEYLIDKKAIGSTIVTDEDVRDAILALHEAEDTILLSFQKELSKIPYCDLTLHDVLSIYLKIYKMTLDALPTEIKGKISEYKLIDLKAIDDAIEYMVVTTEPVERIIESLTVKNILPDEFIKAAKNMVQSDVKTKIVIGDHVPSVNLLQTTFGHSSDEDDIFSGGVQIKEKLNESVVERISKYNTNLEEDYALDLKSN